MADAHITQGNAHYKSRSYEQAAESFTCALEELYVPASPAPRARTPLATRADLPSRDGVRPSQCKGPRRLLARVG